MKMDELSDTFPIPLLKGANTLVDKQAAEIVNKYGRDMLNDVAKLNFKNTLKLEEYL